MSSTDLTIAAELEKLPLKSGATDLVTLLLQNYAVETKETRRNVATSTALLTRSKKAYDSIETLIENVDKTTASEFLNVWKDFENYTDAIPILERILFDLHLEVSSGHEKTHLPPVDVLLGINFIEVWVKDRDVINKALTNISADLPAKLADAAKDLSAVWKDERHTDDIATLKALVARITVLNPIDRWISQPRTSKLVTAISAHFKQISESILNLPSAADTWVVFIVRTMALILIPFEILSPDSTYDKEKNPFRVIGIWNKAKELLDALSKADKSSAAPGDDLETLWEDLRKLLLATTPDISLIDDLIAIIKMAALIRRPFHGRSVRVIQMIRVLEQHVSKESNSVDKPIVLQLMKDVQPILTSAQKAVTSVKDYKIDSEVYQGMSSEFQKALNLIKTCYTDFELSTEWDKQKEQYDKTVTDVDEGHLAAFRKRLSLSD